MLGPDRLRKYYLKLCLLLGHTSTSGRCSSACGVKSCARVGSERDADDLGQ
jgi:hypothetical protein